MVEEGVVCEDGVEFREPRDVSKVDEGRRGENRSVVDVQLSSGGVTKKKEDTKEE